MAVDCLNIPKKRSGFVVRVGSFRNGRRVTQALESSHCHHELESNLVVAGSARYLVDDGWYDLGPGTHIWLHPRQEHLLVDMSSDFSMYVAVYRQRMLRRLCNSDDNRDLMLPAPTHRFCKHLPTKACKQIKEIYHQAHLAEEDDLFNAALGYLALSAWRKHRLAESVDAIGEAHPAVERAASLMHEDATPRNLDELAEEAGLSASRLSRLFKQQAGVSLSRYRQTICLNRFVQCYGKGRKLNLTQAALEAGFGSYPQFHRVFTREFGYSPAEYRRRMGED